MTEQQESFPSTLTAMVFGHVVKSNFSVADENAVAPPKVGINPTDKKTEDSK